MKTVDACGISCPEPLLRLKNTLKTDKDVLLLVDSENALSNCEEYAKKQGFTVSTTSEGYTYKVRITTGNE